MNTQPVRKFASALALGLLLGGCSALPNTPRMGMVVDEQSGLMFGSAIEGSVVTDASFYTNKTLKVRTRNTSGDVAFNLSDFTNDLSAAYGDKGYQPIADGEPFGLMMDINVLYSGQIQTNQTVQYSVVGALLGSTYGGVMERGNIVANSAGAALGHVIGQFPTEDTYMIVAEVTFGVVKGYKPTQKRVTFSRSAKLVDIDDPTQDEQVYARGFKKTFSSQFTVYAGGRNLSQSEIADQVRRRAVRIAADFI